MGDHDDGTSDTCRHCNGTYTPINFLAPHGIRAPRPFTGRFRFRNHAGLLVLQVQVEGEPKPGMISVRRQEWLDATIEALTDISLYHFLGGQ